MFLHMPAVDRPANQPGDFLVDYEEKVFPDVKAEPGEMIDDEALAAEAAKKFAEEQRTTAFAAERAV